MVAIRKRALRPCHWTVPRVANSNDWVETYLAKKKTKKKKIGGKNNTFWTISIETEAIVSDKMNVQLIWPIITLGGQSNGHIIHHLNGENARHVWKPPVTCPIVIYMIVGPFDKYIFQSRQHRRFLALIELLKCLLFCQHAGIHTVVHLHPNAFVHWLMNKQISLKTTEYLYFFSFSSHFSIGIN